MIWVSQNCKALEANPSHTVIHTPGSLGYELNVFILPRCPQSSMRALITPRPLPLSNSTASKIRCLLIPALAAVLRDHFPHRFYSPQNSIALHSFFCFLQVRHFCYWTVFELQALSSHCSWRFVRHNLECWYYHIILDVCSSLVPLNFLSHFLHHGISWMLSYLKLVVLCLQGVVPWRYSTIFFTARCPLVSMASSTYFMVYVYDPPLQVDRRECAWLTPTAL